MKNVMERNNTHTQGTLPATRKLIASSISTILLTGACFATAPVWAQEAASATQPAAQSAEQTENADETTEVIEVKGIRFSQRSALDRKKMAGTITDSLVAEDIGMFPDKNVGEALQRIPGVQLDRDFGEGQQISIRGVEPGLLRVEVNNVTAQGFGGSRAVDFRDMAAELIKSLDVIKGSEARLTEGGIGGTVQVNTRKPNEFKENFLSATAEGQFNDLIDDPSNKFNVTGVYKFDDDLGVLLNVTKSTKNTMIHAIRNTEWVRFADYDNSPEKTFTDAAYADVTDKAACADTANKAACEQQWWDFSPRLPRYGIWGREEDRLSANAVIQYRINDNLQVHGGYTYNTRDKEAQDLNLHLETHSAARVKADSVIVDDQHNVTYFESAAATVTNRTLQFAWDQTTEMFETGFEFDMAGWRVEGLLAHSRSDQDIDSKDTHVTADGIAGVQVDLNAQGMPEWDFNTGYFVNASDPTDTSDKFDVNDPASYRSRARYKYAPVTDESDETMAKLDFTYIPDSDLITLIRFGGQLREQSYANANFEYNIIRDVGRSYTNPETGESMQWTLDDQIALITGNTFQSPQLFDGYSLGVNTIGTYQAINTYPFIEAIQAVANDFTSREDLNVRSGNYDVSVDTQAVYLQANFETELAGMRLWGNVGARYVETQTAANGDVIERIIVDQVDEDGNVLLDPVTGEPLSGIEDPDHPDAFNGRKTVEEEYSDFLPSLNMNLAIIEDELVLYVGTAKVMSRPKITDLNVNANCTLYRNSRKDLDDLRDYCTAGNPALKPYRAKQFDVALNWYPDENSIISGAYFIKDITSWVIDAETRFDVDFFNDGRNFDVRQKVNGSGVTTKGIELQASTVFSFLPEPFNGLGGAINYTRMSADDVGLFNSLTGKELPFPSQSENSYNLTAFYETDTWSFRMAYNYRDEYLVAAADRSGNPVFVEDSGYLDAKFIYNITENFRAYVDGRNLTGEVKAYTAGPRRLSDLQWSGREYSVGVIYQF
ncbi:TonB-dependent receptor [Aestuariibacter sp. GS-14]|uniref:TonB-dependent receptor n=1 Tax=Aestuariibacter sp. GS-14 TaxID=2590670 RepID=UPI00112DDEB2|nr:TonB-dependent receptor [Aestuariibacter sp. GS-14]TPV59171.1 TonB-dependent receptor [Aestuariibacter sp. GS-14]